MYSNTDKTTMSFVHLLGHNFQAFLSKNFTACIYIYIIILYIYWLVVWNMAFIFPNSWDDDPI